MIQASNCIACTARFWKYMHDTIFPIHMYLFPSQKVLYFSDFLFLFNKPEIDTIFVTEHVIKENIYIYIYTHKNKPNILIQIHSCNILLHFCYGDEIKLQSKHKKGNK